MLCWVVVLLSRVGGGGWMEVWLVGVVVVGGVVLVCGVLLL